MEKKIFETSILNLLKAIIYYQLATTPEELFEYSIRKLNYFGAKEGVDEFIAVLPEQHSARKFYSKLDNLNNNDFMKIKTIAFIKMIVWKVKNKVFDWKFIQEDEDVAQMAMQVANTDISSVEEFVKNNINLLTKNHNRFKYYFAILYDEKLIAYYKCKIEDDERYDKRIANEERDAYRVVKALSNSKRPITIKNIGDLARLLNVAKQLTSTDGRNIFEDFCSIPQVETIINNITSRKPEQIQVIQDYDFLDWKPMETPLEQDHRLIEEFKRVNTNEIYTGTLSRIREILATSKPIQIKSEAKSEKELTEKHKAILAMSKMFMRKNGLVPNSELKFEEGRIVLGYLDAEKVFGSDIIKAEEQTMGITPAQAEEEKKREEIKKAVLDRWKGRQREKNNKIQQEEVAYKRKRTKGKDRGISR